MRLKMNAALVVTLVLTAFCLALPPLAGAEENPEMPAGLAKTIDDAIVMLEEGRHAEFIQTYADPKDLKELLQKVSLDELVANFADGKAGKLLEVLNQTKSAVPEYNPDERTATFEREGPDLVFVEIDGRWYLKN